jgi:hypothetical protein
MRDSLRRYESLVHCKNHELVQAESRKVEGQEGNKQRSVVTIHAYIIARPMTGEIRWDEFYTAHSATTMNEN